MTRLLVIGADAAGMAAAYQALRVARRRGRSLEVVALEMSTHTSYSQCGIPYWVAGDVADASSLVARTAEQHRAAGIDLRLRHEALGLDLARGECETRDHASGRTVTIGFDDVLLATGAAPVVPGWAEGLGPNVHPMKTLDDGSTWRAIVAGRPRHVLVVGGGYIGVEAAEALARRGVRTTLLTRREPMAASLVPEQRARVRAGLEAIGVTVVGGAEIAGAEIVGAERVGAQSARAQRGPDHPTPVTLTTTTGDEHTGDAVVLALGVAPRTRLAVEAGLPVAGDEFPYARRALVPDARQRLADHVWAAGDCCAVADLIVRQPSYLPLGTHANKAGRVAGTNLGGGDARFPGAVGTAITRAGDVEVARTGVHADWDLGYDPAVTTLDATTASGYMPQAEPMHIWAAGDRLSGRLLGVQITGGRGAGKRIDACAAALMAGLTCEEFAYLDLSYAPPFSPAWDPVQIAVRKLAESFA